ncbi:hypothetical protein [Protaetiibacter larvae]|uniref:Phage tail protein n=1 Tax=Protaetiibacter larvae TaxID=2592654 RepID=A0A5C1Y649_9MICO|nr:hypothetical protein [Protaetiibacter larvae]QEO08888.1 hypothetical protein FLP23_01935 [Protaetiibacter larvae]
MAQIPLAARPQKDIRVKVGADNYEKHVSDINWPSNQTAQSWHGGTPDAIAPDLSEGDQVCNLTFIQAWDDEDSFCRFAFDHAGETVTISYKPHADSDVEFTAEVTLIRPQIGGKVNQFNESTISMPSTVPTLVPVP